MEWDTEASCPAPVRVLDIVRHRAARVATRLHARLAFVSTDFSAEKLRLTRVLYSALATLYLFFTALILALLFVMSTCWHTPYRFQAIGGFTLLFFLIGAGIAWNRVRAKRQSRRRVFAASLTELYGAQTRRARRENCR